MSEKELKEFRAILKKQNEEVNSSKDAALALLKSLGLVDAKGRVKKIKAA